MPMTYLIIQMERENWSIFFCSVFRHQRPTTTQSTSHPLTHTAARTHARSRTATAKLCMCVCVCMRGARQHKVVVIILQHSRHGSRLSVGFT